MKILVIGLGSMGKRRLRCLKYIEENDNSKFELFGYDKSIIRVNESESLFNIKKYDNYEAYFKNNIDLIIISTPPQYHEFYIFDSIKRNIKFFVEAGVFNNNTSLVENKLFQNNVIGMPSSTLYFHPAIRKISEIVNSGKLGKISNIFYHSGQYLPDWHSYEHVKDYYVSNKDTGGAREIVPFELTWLVKIFGFPIYVSGNYKKTIEIEGAEIIDDTYNLVLDYDSFSINMTVDVVSRYATRNLTINGSLFQLTWSWDTNNILIKSNSNDPEIETINIETMNPADGYNKNITEEMYVDEIREFINYNTDYKNEIVNNFYLDNNTIEILNNLEEAYDNKKYVKFVNIGILIHIRLESTRLKEKHIIKVKDKYLLEYQILRIKNQIDKLENINPKIILNVSDISRDKYYNLLYEICKKHNIHLFFGNNNSIPMRILECSDYYGLTHIVSVDGDDILVSGEQITNICHNMYNNPNLEYIYSKDLPLGMNIAGFSYQVLKKSLKNSNEHNDTGWGYIFDNVKKTVLNINIKVDNYDKIRLTLDYEIDLHLFQNILENNSYYISDSELINYINNNELYKINESIIQEYWDNFNKNKTH
jgi:spore coat polysaccharide biosynthesis protein SpsF (cytidylyltransferase family)/predicted dehydrogenase|uniref:Gfo/Idh/MocA-like oxidoreductase N-terminal domain-containing protein n=1 Tax=viral metagenome TaxID=1070528 RepID=A0A6C0ITQ4_9ZZZZ